VTGDADALEEHCIWDVKLEYELAGGQDLGFLA
jgi:hypothetical protein